MRQASAPTEELIRVALISAAQQSSPQQDNGAGERWRTPEGEGMMDVGSSAL